MREALKKEIMQLSNEGAYKKKTITIGGREFFLKRSREANGRLFYTIQQINEEWISYYTGSSVITKDSDLNLNVLIDSFIQDRECGREALKELRNFDIALNPNIDSIMLALERFKGCDIKVGRVTLRFSIVLDDQFFVLIKLEDRAKGALQREFNVLDPDFVIKEYQDLISLMENDLKLDF